MAGEALCCRLQHLYVADTDAYALLIGPVVRSWLIWREWVSASREANLVADVLDRMEVAPWPRLEPGTKSPEENASDGKAAAAVRQGTHRRDAP
jgi:hypothetical protein